MTIILVLLLFLACWVFSAGVVYADIQLSGSEWAANYDRGSDATMAIGISLVSSVLFGLGCLLVWCCTYADDDVPGLPTWAFPGSDTSGLRQMVVKRR